MLSNNHDKCKFIIIGVLLFLHQCIYLINRYLLNMTGKILNILSRKLI